MTTDNELFSEKFYSSTADAPGVVGVELPAVPGSPFPRETIQARHIPNVIISRVERALDPSFAYLRGSVGEAAGSVFAHYVGALQGSEMVDKSTSRALDKLVNEFANTAKPDQPKYFAEKIKPFIAALGTAKR